MYRALTLLVAATLSGQWINEPARSVPRTRDGKPNLTAPTPRMGGKPDFTGLWQADTAPPGEAEKIIPGLSLSSVLGDDPTTFSKYLFETVGLNPRSPLDAFSHPRSDTMRLKERWSRRDFGHLDIQVTIEDSKYYSKPITFKYSSTVIPDDDLLEWVCTENEKDKSHIK